MSRLLTVPNTQRCAGHAGRRTLTSQGLTFRPSGAARRVGQDPAVAGHLAAQSVITAAGGRQAHASIIAPRVRCPVEVSSVIATTRLRDAMMITAVTERERRASMTRTGKFDAYSSAAAMERATTPSAASTLTRIPSGNRRDTCTTE